MRIAIVPCLKDNYAYLLIDEAQNTAVVVDPSEARPVAEAAKREGVELKAIWNTHHHYDHVGGNKELLDEHPELEVVGHASDRGRIPGQTTFAEEGDKVTVGSIEARVIHNPGHTSGAISYFVESEPAVFTGDTLFLAGCGRLFEGTPAQMHESLTKLASLPGDTDVYCGHEYTAANLRFAAAVEPNSSAIQTRADRVAAQRSSDNPTVPAKLSEELSTNPFIRVAEKAVIEAAQREEQAPDQTPQEVLGAIRRWKDRF